MTKDSPAGVQHAAETADVHRTETYKVTVKCKFVKEALASYIEKTGYIYILLVTDLHSLLLFYTAAINT